MPAFLTSKEGQVVHVRFGEADLGRPANYDASGSRPFGVTLPYNVRRFLIVLAMAGPASFSGLAAIRHQGSLNAAALIWETCPKPNRLSDSPSFAANPGELG